MTKKNEHSSINPHFPSKNTKKDKNHLNYLHNSERSSNFATANVTRQSGAPTRNLVPYGESGALEDLNESNVQQMTQSVSESGEREYLYPNYRNSHRS